MTRVIKIGGRAQVDPSLTTRITRAWNDTRGELVVVHGGGDEISELQRRLGSNASFIGGRRVTTHTDIDLVRMVLSGVANKRLVSALVAASVPAVGISGEDGGLITAVQLDVELGRVGRPVSVNPVLLELLLGAGFLPVVSPISSATGDANGGALNVNGDDAAAAIALALGAEELVLVVDVEGVLDRKGKVVDILERADASGLVSGGIVNQGMLAKLEAGFAALAGGVGKVRIAGLSGLDGRNAGTTLTLTPSLT